MQVGVEVVVSRRILKTGESESGDDRLLEASTKMS